MLRNKQIWSKLKKKKKICLSMQGILFDSGFPGSSGGKEPTHNVGDQGSIPGSGRSPGEGHGNPPQHSCLENSMDRGARWAAVHGVAKSRTWLSDYFHSFILPGTKIPHAMEQRSLCTTTKTQPTQRNKYFKRILLLLLVGSGCGSQHGDCKIENAGTTEAVMSPCGPGGKGTEPKRVILQP